MMQHLDTWQLTIDRRSRLRNEAHRWRLRVLAENGEDPEVTAPGSSKSPTSSWKD